MNQQEGTFSGRNSHRIYWQAWLPERVRAAVVVVHGVGEHSGRYAHVAKLLVDAGCAVYALDHHGHGQSEGRRALIDSFDNAVADIDTLVERAHKEQPGKPLYLLGHSMGGALALAYALQHGAKLAGLMLSAAAVALDGLPPLAGPITKLLAAIAPGMGVIAVDPSLVSRDQEIVAAYAADPLNCHGKLPARTVAEIVRFSAWLPPQLPKLTLPMLVMHGGQDKLAGVAGSKMVHAKAASTDKTLKIYETLYHEIFNELPADRARVLADLAAWLSPRLPV